ncbi:hypothetical protein GCM10010400_36570 [Streptomyces aculeolatus]
MRSRTAGEVVSAVLPGRFELVAVDQMASAVRVLTPPRRKSKKNAFAWRGERHDLQHKALPGASGANMESRT